MPYEFKTDCSQKQTRIWYVLCKLFYIYIYIYIYKVYIYIYTYAHILELRCICFMCFVCLIKWRGYVYEIANYNGHNTLFMLWYVNQSVKSCECIMIHLSRWMIFIMLGKQYSVNNCIKYTVCKKYLVFLRSRNMKTYDINRL